MEEIDIEQLKHEEYVREKSEELLDKYIDKFTEELKEYIFESLDDKFSSNEIVASDIDQKLVGEKNKPYAQFIVLRYAMRSVFYDAHNYFGEEGVIQLFNNAFYQIGAGNLGPANFHHIASPYDEEQK